MRLCGISSRFQLLSPCTGQVTHALLTRPPLSSSRKKNFVRLACVKHAASVYPEPGSNSHVQFSVQFCANAFLSVCVSYLKDFTVFIGCSLYYAKNFTRLIAFAIRLFKKSSGLVILFNYQGSLSLDRWPSDLIILSQLQAFVKHFFNFFYFHFRKLFFLFEQFSKLFLSCHYCAVAVCCNVDYNTTPFANCQPLFSCFFKILLVFFRQTIYNFPSNAGILFFAFQMKGFLL